MSLTAAAATPSVLRQNIMRMMEQTGLKGNAESQAELMEQILPALAQRLSMPAPPSPFDSAAISQYTIFVQQVLPLYNYQMKNRITPQPITDELKVKHIYQTPKDACYFGIGDKRNTYAPKGIDCAECEAKGGKTKASGSYAWGMTALDGKIYWSTNNNYLCMPGYTVVASTGKETGPYENSCWTCEMQKSVAYGHRGAYADILPPRVFCYDTKTGVVTDITPADTMLNHCQGLRSAAYHKGVMFFGGPSIKGGTSTESGTSVFLAYNPATQEFIGSSDMASVQGCQITNVRRWIVVDDVLYCGVGLLDTQGKPKGAVLRWNGSVADPFNFEIVGWTSSEAAEIEYHKGHIFVGGWPTQTSPSALYKSPKIPAGGFKAANATEWEKVWQYSSYEANNTSKIQAIFQ